MSKHVYVHLTPEQRVHLEGLIRVGNAPARTQTRARILLLADRNQAQRLTDSAVAAALLCSPNTVGTIRRRYVREGLDAARLAQHPLPHPLY